MDNITAYVSANPSVRQTFLLPEGKSFPSEAVPIPDDENLSDEYFYVWAELESKSGLLKYQNVDLGQRVRIAIHESDISKIQNLVEKK